MALLITDRDVSFDSTNTPQASPSVVGQTVTVTALTQPIYITTDGTNYYEDEMGGLRTVTPNPTTGIWSLTLPWPSQTRTATQWQIKRTDGRLIAGTVPEGISGPVTCDILMHTYAWAEAIPTV